MSSKGKWRKRGERKFGDDMVKCLLLLSPSIFALCGVERGEEKTNRAVEGSNEDHSDGVFVEDREEERRLSW
jgi:hypothetical protein